MDTARVKPWKTSEDADGGLRSGAKAKPTFTALLFFLALVLIPCTAAAQDPLDALIRKAAKWLDQNRDSALHYAQTAVDIAEFEERDKMIARALSVRGRAQLRLKAFPEATRDFQRSHYLFMASGDRMGVANCLLWIGQAYETQDKLDSAITYFDSALVSLRVISATAEIARTHIRIGKVYERSGERQVARKSYVKALNVAEAARDDFEMARAEQHLGYLYLELGKYKLAENDLLSAMAIFEKMKEEEELARTFHGLAIVNLRRQKFEVAEDFGKRGLKLAQEAGSRALTMDFYQFLGDLHEEQGEFETALDYRRLKEVIRDSLLGDATARQLSELVSQYEQDKLQLENEKKAQEIALKNATLKIQDQEIKSQNTRFFVILGGLIAFFLFAIVLVYAFVQKNRANRRLKVALDNLRTAQDQLVRTEKLASLGQVTAGIAHEIRNPLNFVNSLSKLSVSMVDEVAEELTEMQGKSFDGAGAEMVFEYFSDIRSNASKVLEHGERATRIVKDMLQHAASGSQEKQPEDINAMVQEYLQVAFHAARSSNDAVDYALKMEPDPHVGAVRVHRSDLGRALLNIFGNAFEAMEGKWIRDNTYNPVLSVSTFRRGDKIEIAISDNGPGIAPEHREKIFEPFFTTKPPNKGTGLGLSLAHETIVQVHDGYLRVETELGSGTTMTVILPAR